MSLDLEELGKDIAVQAAGVAIGKVIDQFSENHPDLAKKAALGVDVLQQAMALIPDDKLAAFLTSEDAAAAELAFRLAKAAKFGK